MRRNCSVLLVPVLALAVLALAGCRTAANANTKPSKPPPAFPLDARLPAPAGLDMDALDVGVSPCDDFYRFACGGWEARTPIPADRAIWGKGFDTVDERNQQILKDLLESLAAGRAPKGAVYAQQLADFYGTCMDEPKLEESLPVFQHMLEPIRALKDLRGLPTLLAQLHRSQVDAVFTLASQADFENASEVIAQIDQGGLTLPERDYYLSDAAAMKDIRTHLREHVKAMFHLIGEPVETAEADADAVMRMETAIAQASQGVVARREPKSLYHRLDREGVAKAAPHFAWSTYFNALRLPAGGVNVTNPELLTAFDGWLSSTPPATWRAYLSWRLMVRFVLALPKAIEDESFRFTSKSLTGLEHDLPRWKKCARDIDVALGDALGQPFLARSFSPVAREKSGELVKALEAVMHDNLTHLDWMDAQTRARAVEKLEHFHNDVGYPDHWRDFSALKTSKTSFLENENATNVFATDFDLAKVGKPYDAALWEVTMPTVNAYYEPHHNVIVFPAGILQPPFFSELATDAVNAGAAGMVIGHEITHGFDDEGRHYDGLGNLQDWWSKGSDAAFASRAQCVVQQFDHAPVREGADLRVNGKLTLGENVADLGGLKIAFGALQRELAVHPAPAAQLTPAQQFFVSYAQAWCTKTRPETLKVLLASDPHSPADLRVNLPLRNLGSFRQAFACKEGQKMAPRTAARSGRAVPPRASARAGSAGLPAWADA